MRGSGLPSGMATCDQCGLGQAVLHPTPTRQICDRCFDEYQGLASGVLSSKSSGNPTGNAISVLGWLRAIRRRS